MILLNNLELGWQLNRKEAVCEGYKLRIDILRIIIMIVGVCSKENEEQKEKLGRIFGLLQEEFFVCFRYEY